MIHSSADKLLLRDELVIPLALSEETLEIAERLIVHWLVEGRSKEEMERVLEEELALLG
ncbi:MAG: hypothetical protein IPO07_12850 [Haliscomenobacter sp.]|nr:hypothetical protein [Haliscomenobacter sp.]MBK9489570.1 hypothetical protein [Haliscomenobacter sp.]